jgi:hypothetical protein
MTDLNNFFCFDSLINHHYQTKKSTFSRMLFSSYMWYKSWNSDFFCDLANGQENFSDKQYFDFQDSFGCLLLKNGLCLSNSRKTNKNSWQTDRLSLFILSKSYTLIYEGIYDIAFHYISFLLSFSPAFRIDKWSYERKN